MRLKSTAVATALVLIWAPAILAAVINVPADQPTIDAAITAAVAGDQIVIADGIYPVSSTLNVTKSLTLTGQSEAGVILQIDTGASWGMYLAADDIIVENMTLDVVTSGPEAGFPIHAAGTTNLPNGFSNLTLQHLTVKGDLTTTPKRRTGVDVHGYNNVVLDDIDARDASWGNGVQVTGCVGVTMSNITTSNNAWGSIAVYVSGPAYLNRGSDNVVIDGNTLALGENSIYQQDESGLFSTNVSVTGYEYQVFNDDFRPDAAGFTFFVDTLGDAQTLALAFVGFESGSSIRRVLDGHYVVGPGMSIQTGVDDAPAGGTVEVLAGTYTEQVVIQTAGLQLVGADRATTTLVSPASLPFTFASTSKTYHPVLVVEGVTGTRIEGLTVDGAGQGNANVSFLGIAYHNGDGELAFCRVTGVRNTPLDGSQHGVALYSLLDDGGSYTIDCHDNLVDDFQKNGTAFNAINGTGLTLTCTGNQVTGVPGLTADNGDPAQNGIQVLGDLVTANLTGNTVTGIGYDNTNATTKWVATSVLLYYGSFTVENNLIGSAQTALYLIEGDAVVRGNDVTVNKVGDSGFGLITADPPRAVAQPFEVEGTGGVQAKKAGVLSILVENNLVQFSGPDNVGTTGIEADSGYLDFLSDGPEDLIVNILGNEVHGFEAGVAFFECTSGCTGGSFVSGDVHQNDLSGNTWGLFTDATSIVVDASCNWWGDLSGPMETTQNPAGLGAAVQGAAVFEPWLDGPGGACNLSTDYVSAGPPPSEINACTNCVEVPVNVSRTDTDAVRGVSVTFRLSPELELCGTPTLSLGAGTMFDGFGPTQEFFLDNGDGTYTFDVAILGLPCGPTVGGELTKIPVTHVAGIVTDTTGQIDIVSVTMRDCANASLSILPGPGTSVDIDVTAPGAVTSLTASQLRSGNDTDGTTKIDLNWTLPADPDLTAIAIYRKGFGQYPEYDDLGGSVPTVPADPATALANGWVLAGNAAPTATTFTDEPATRDFWYYVAFALDECYASAPSNATGGTLNYHLGDVAPAPSGDNAVSTADISALGAAYGTVDGDVNYDAAADVGPTTDFSVNARPTTDNRIQFEDLIVFAINYAQVSRRPTLPVAATNTLEIESPSALSAGETVSVPVRMQGDGSIQGLSLQLRWDDRVLAYRGYSAGDLMARQGPAAPVLSAAPGNVDVALLGVAEQGIAGEGILATLHFEVLEPGDPALDFESIDARNSRNEKIGLDGTVLSGAPSQPVTVRRSELRTNVPNPFNPRTTVRFALAQEGRVQVRVFDLAGRLVETLIDGPMGVGEHSIVWDGIDSGGRSVASGSYVIRLDAPDRSDSRTVTLLK